MEERRTFQHAYESAISTRIRAAATSTYAAKLARLATAPSALTQASRRGHRIFYERCSEACESRGAWARAVGMRAEGGISAFLRRREGESSAAKRFTLVIYALIAMGLGLRCLAYVANPSFSLDEAQLGLNVIERSFGSLLNQLYFNQGAPSAFLETTKAATSLLGTTELALRALPFAAALLAIPLFWRVASELLEARTSLVIAVALFSASMPLTVFGSTAKQYSSDVLVGLVLSVSGLRALQRKSLRDLGLLSVLGATLVWFSHPAVFTLAGITLALAASTVFDRGARRSLVPLAAATAIWVASFAGSYLTARTTLQHLRHSLENTSGFPVASSGESVTFIRAAAGSFRYLAGIGDFTLGGVEVGKMVAFVFLLLCILGFALRCRRVPAQSLLLAVPPTLALIAIAVGRYPHYPRVSLFAVPALVIFAAEGLGALVRAPGRVSEAIPCWAVACLCLVFTIPPGVKAALDPSGREALRPVMKHLASIEQPGEGLYLYHSLQYAFGYYLQCECFAGGSLAARAAQLWPVRPTHGDGQWDPAVRSVSSKVVIGRRLGGSALAQIPDLARLPRRSAVWVVFGDISQSEQASLLRCLDSLGSRRQSFARADEAVAAHAYLYAFPEGGRAPFGAKFRSACLAH